MLVGLGTLAKMIAWPAESSLAPTPTAVPSGLAAGACWAAQQRSDAAPAVAAWPLMPLEAKQMSEEQLAVAAVAGLMWTQLWAARLQLVS